jgi:hypothetical protein
VYLLLNSVTGSAEDADINTVECMGPPGDPIDMVSLVGHRVHRFNTFVCVEIRGYG